MLTVDQSVMQSLIQDSLKNAAEMEIDSDANKEGPAADNKPEEKQDEPMDGVAEEDNQNPDNMHN